MQISLLFESVEIIGMQSIPLWEMTLPDTRIAGSGLYAMALFAFAVGVVRLAKPLPPAWRRTLTVTALAIMSHGIWWLPHLFHPATMARPIGPFLSSLSQLAAVGLFDLAYRLDLASSRQPDARYKRFSAYFFGAASLIFTLVLGHLSLGLPVTFRFDSVAFGLIILVPIILAAILSYPEKPSWPLKTTMASVAMGLAAASINAGTDILAFGTRPTHWSVLPQTALTLAIACTIIPCIILASISIWKSQLRFVANLRCAIEALPVGLALYDEEDRLLVWNEAMLGISGDAKPKLTVGMNYREALVAGLKASLYPPGANRDDEWLNNHVKNHKPGDWIIQSQDGSRWMRLQNRGIEDGGLVTIASDFTEQKRHEAELAEALDQARSANIAKSRFLANMSHEIRTPLNGMIAMTDALSRTELNDKQAEMVSLVRSSGDTLQVLLSDILDLARIESGQMKITNAPFDLVRLIDDTQSLYANAACEKGVQFACHIMPDARSWVMGDEVRTRQILNNLLSNAVKFTNEGHITLTISRREDLVQMRVDDTGIGFETANLQHLFGRFAQADDQITRRYGGSGLGLSICSELADMMGGSVYGTSQTGLGSSFTASLPLQRITTPNPDVPSAPALSTVPVKNSDVLRVLLADDNATNRRVVQLILDAKNFDLVEVENGHEAFEAVTNSHFDLVLMDMQMPVMDGLTATRRIREHEKANGLPRIALIMLTANAMPEHVSASLEAGADAHLAKPFNVSQMLELTYKLTQKNQPA